MLSLISGTLMLLHFVLVWPRVHVATKAVYSRLGELTAAGGNATLCVDALNTGNATLLKQSLYNRLEHAAFEMHSEIHRTKRQVRDVCNGAALMAGSGSAVFGICEDRKEAVQAKRELQNVGLTFDTASYAMPD